MDASGPLVKGGHGPELRWIAVDGTKRPATWRVMFNHSIECLTIASAAVVAAALAVQAWPSARDALALHRPAIAAGQWWRLVTGHIVHCDWRHLAADAGTFALLCWIGLRRPRTALTVVVLSAVAAGVAVYLWAGGITTYMGISGINYALLAWLLLVRALEERGWRALAYGAVLAAICGKAVFEAATGAQVVNVCLPPGVEVVAVAHVAGIVVGVAAALLPPAASVLQGACDLLRSGDARRTPKGRGGVQPTAML
ncbi:MAG: rhombosortase [Planctomycetes bacterium]|nr:rhombosortase [Planctomycetota bacterium]